MYYNTQQNQYNVRPSLARIKCGLYESKEIFTYLRNNGPEKSRGVLRGKKDRDDHRRS